MINEKEILENWSKAIIENAKRLETDVQYRKELESKLSEIRLKGLIELDKIENGQRIVANRMMGFKY